MKEKAILNDVYRDCPIFSSLSLQKQKFVVEYFKDFNATQAAIRASYSKKTANQQGPRLLVSVGIQAALAEVSSICFRADIADVKELREYWTMIKRGDISDVCSWNERDGIAWSASSEGMDRNTAKLIKKIKTTTRTSAKGDWTEVETNIELHDPLKASELLGRSLGIFIDKTALTDPSGAPLTFKVVYEKKSSPDEQ